MGERLPTDGRDLEFQLLGPFAVRAHGRTVAVASPKHRILLAALLLQADRTVPVDALADAVWGDAPPDKPRKALQLHVIRLRKLLKDAAGETAGAIIVTDADGYRAGVRPEQVDLGRFRSWVRRADEAARRGDLDGEADALREALAQWHGEPLAGMPSELLQREVVPRLAERRLEVVERRLEVELRRGRHAEPGGELIGELVALTAQHPLRERLWGLLMRALDAAGRRAEALDAYHRLRRLLADELGIDPSDELQRLHTTILVGRSRPTLLPPVPRQLPLDLPAFIGRTGELAHLDTLVDDPGADRASATVVGLITGTAGIGKTALAVHWAHRVADRFPDGQLWANLHGDNRESTVAPARTLRRFLRSLGVPDDGIPPDVDEQIGLYRSLMDGRRMLVLLDDAESAQQVRPLLPGAPGSLVLVTSRCRLSGLVAAEGARPMELGPLAHAEARLLLTVRLGADRVNAEPAAREEIIEHCAGLPIALTQVAARAATHPDLGLHTVATELSQRRLDLRAPTGEHRGLDVDRPNVARMYDYFLGGKDNFAADREAAEKVLSIVPEARFVARANREFLGRAVRFLAEAGIRQFIDLGTGLPTQANVHEVVHRIDPGARVVYVDNDPVVIAHAQALLHAEDTTTIIEADVRDPESVLGHSGLRALIDFKEPVAVLMAAILHLVTDAENPDGIITAFRNAMAPGSYLVLSHVTTDPRPQAKVPVTDVYRTANAPMVPRTRDRVRRFFTGLDLVDPGVVYAPEWRPDGERPLSEPQRSFIFAGVGYKHALP